MSPVPSKSNSRGHNPLLGYWYKLYNEPTAAELHFEPAVASLGLPYRFQHPCSNKYFLDFALPTLKINIEVDGDSHYKPAQKKKDAEKTKFLEERGWRTVRVRNEVVMADPYGAIDRIMEKLGFPYRSKRI